MEGSNNNTKKHHAVKVLLFVPVPFPFSMNSTYLITRYPMSVGGVELSFIPHLEIKQCVNNLLA